MKKKENQLKEFKLEFHFNKDGLYVIGNKFGLNELSNLLRNTAKAKVFYHNHLNFTWSDKMKDGNFIINFDWITSKAKTKKSKKYDVTIMKAEKIGKDLWGTKKSIGRKKTLGSVE